LTFVAPSAPFYLSVTFSCDFNFLPGNWNALFFDGKTKLISVISFVSALGVAAL